MPARPVAQPTRQPSAIDCAAEDVPDRRTLRQRRGDAAEALAARFLEHCGLHVLERGFRRRIGELDLICVDPQDGGIVFVEVRYRASFSHGGPLASVGIAKRLKLERTARAWLQSRRIDPRRPARIDVIGISRQAPPGALPGCEPNWQRFDDQALCWCRAII